MTDQQQPHAPQGRVHVIEDGDGVCGDCLWCDENTESDCNVPTDPKCDWCGHCLSNHGDDRS